MIVQYMSLLLILLIIIAILIPSLLKKTQVQPLDEAIHSTNKNKKPLIFIHNSKCGGTTICQMCMQNSEICCNKNNCNCLIQGKEIAWWNFKKSQILKQRHTVFAIEFLTVLPRTVLEWAESNEFRSIICIREPVSRFISAAQHWCYTNKKKFHVQNLVSYIHNNDHNDDHNGYFAFGQCKRLSRKSNVQEAIKNLNKFDSIINISMFKNTQYKKDITEDVKKKMEWHNVDFDKTYQTSSYKPDVNRKKKAVANLPIKELDFLKQKLKVDIDFYTEAVRLIETRYNLKTTHENHSEIEFFDD